MTSVQIREALTPDYDSTVARIAGNLLSGIPLRTLTLDERALLVHEAVYTARAIVDETRRTEPAQEEG